MMTPEQAVGELALIRAIQIQIKYHRFKWKMFSLLRLHQRSEREAQITLDCRKELSRRSKSALSQLRED